MKALLSEIKNVIIKITHVYWALIKIMVPALIVVKVLEMLGATEYLALALSPVMSLVGLPDSMGLVWAATMLVNIYTGMAVFFGLALSEPLTVAQVTVLSTMMLFAHGLVVEGAIAKASGIAWSYSLALRIGAAFLIGVLLHLFYSSTGSLQEVSEVLWQPELVGNDLASWGVLQLKTLAIAFIIISGLVILMRILEVLGIEKLLHWMLTPFLRSLGIGKEAANITIIGFTLGLSFGGGLLIEQARSGMISKRNVFLSMSFLCLCHSLIEDTLLMLLLGADLSGILWARLAFTFVVIASIAHFSNFFRKTSY